MIGSRRRSSLAAGDVHFIPPAIVTTCRVDIRICLRSLGGLRLVIDRGMVRRVSGARLRHVDTDSPRICTSTLSY